MKQSIAASILAFAGMFSNISRADSTANSQYEGVSIGYELDRFQNEFGVGINVTTPFALDGRIAVQAAAVRTWFDGTVDSEETWVGYNTYKLGPYTDHSRFVLGF